LFELALRIGFSLLIVFGLMWGLARVIRRPLGGHHRTGALSVLNRQQLSRGSAVAVVRVADRALVLGVTDQQVSLLGETELDAFVKHDDHHEHRDHLELSLTPDVLEGSVLSPRTWRSTMNFLRDRTTRH
jgi:flagellar protein FliO/FliZ